ncbi:MAG: FtsX-like permease family protein [Candidatus Thermoplasmatota archaeon]|nr:FtsX-like permease family protein [Candidatus Thermoplasmatota archaeon]
MQSRKETFNSASYALSHLRFDLLRSLTTISTISVTTAFLLLTSSMLFGLIGEIEGGDDKQGILDGRIPGSISMFEEFDLDQELSSETKASLVNFLILTSLFVFIIAFFIIINTMAISVRERKKEIGILRSVGYSSGEVVKIFMIEGGLIGLISFLVALIFGTPLILNLSAHLIEKGDKGFFFVQPYIPARLLVIILCISMGICLGGTYLAVRKVVLKSPADLFRSDH